MIDRIIQRMADLKQMYRLVRLVHEVNDEVEHDDLMAGFIEEAEDRDTVQLEIDRKRHTNMRKKFIGKIKGMSA